MVWDRDAARGRRHRLQLWCETWADICVLEGRLSLWDTSGHRNGRLHLHEKAENVHGFPDVRPTGKATWGSPADLCAWGRLLIPNGADCRKRKRGTCLYVHSRDETVGLVHDHSRACDQGVCLGVWSQGTTLVRSERLRSPPAGLCIFWHLLGL